MLDYAVPIFPYSLPKYLSQELERVQKRAFAIIYPHLKYEEALNRSGIEHLSTHHQNSCKKLFNTIIKYTNHSLHHLLPPRHNSICDVRSNRSFDAPACKTKRLSNSFIMASSSKTDRFYLFLYS